MGKLQNLHKIKLLSYILNTDGSCTFKKNDIGAIWAGNSIVQLPKIYTNVVSIFRTTHNASFGSGIFENEAKNGSNFVAFKADNKVTSMSMSGVFQSDKIVCRALSMRGGYATVSDIGVYQDVPQTPIYVNCIIIG